MYAFGFVRNSLHSNSVHGKWWDNLHGDSWLTVHLEHVVNSVIASYIWYSHLIGPPILWPHISNGEWPSWVHTVPTTLCDADGGGVSEPLYSGAG